VISSPYNGNVARLLLVRIIMRSLLLFLLAAASALAQPFSVGLKAGVPVTDFVNTARSGNFNYFAHTNRYIIGGQAELRLPFGLGVEFDALYRHLNFSGTGTAGGVNTSVATTANAWEFPLLVKYRFPTPVARPFIDGGVAWDTLTGVKQAISSVSPVSIGDTPAVQDKTTIGYVVGVGLDIKIGIRLQPEIRYTRWGAKHFLDPNGLFNSNQNQAEFLLGVTF
jgi:opacity protein-like surface antigen